MFKNKVIKLFTMVAVTLFSLICIGCNKSKQKVNIDFKMGTESEIVTVEKGTIITKYIFPFTGSLKNVDLYYDDNKVKKYNEEPIDEDITIYAYMKRNVGVEITEEKIKEDYLKYAHLHGETSLSISSVQIINYYGQYDDVAIVRMNRWGYPVITSITFMGYGGFNLEIQFPNTNKPLVYKEGNFYELADAYYEEGIITRKTLIQLKNKIENLDMEQTVNIDFKMGTESEIVTVEKGTIITKYIFPFTGSLKNVDLYYDDNKVKKYNEEPIDEDITIYAYMKRNVGVEITEEKIKEDYLKYAHLHGETSLSISSVQIINYYGQYDDVAIVRMNRWACQVITPIIFMDFGFHLKILFPDTNKPLVYKEGNFYELEDAYYEEGIITRKILIQLKNKIENQNKE
ncbi:MAG: hypothetical protein NC087_00090 [Anaeroplasma bactoclasticum]|nr:hypothetical protein [Anaeroplasma bactoclasticum]MCM1555911.1 hypothetical protein [Anaeroplasma bactoclasticum]